MNMGSDRAKVEPESTEEREVEHVDQEEDGVINKNRSITDQFFIILFGIFLLILVVLLTYCMANGDIFRVLYGYDSCGFICGRKNTVYQNDSNCSQFDKESTPFLIVNPIMADTDNEPIAVNRYCVDNCTNTPGYVQVLTRCIHDKSTIEPGNSYVSKTGFSQFFQETSEDFHVCWLETFYMCAIAFVFSVIILLMFKYLAGIIVWMVLLGLIIMCIIVTIFLWAYYSIEMQSNPPDSIGKRRANTFLVMAIIATVATVIACLVIIFLRKRVHLVICLFKEAGKAATDMPLLLFEPIFTFIALAMLITLWFYFTLWIESAGILSIQANESAQYDKDNAINVTRWYNLMAFFWVSQFIIGCQHMVIAGAVSIWYFTRNKNELGSPISTGFSNLFHYHMGTVALGSLLIALLQFVRSLFRFVDYSTKTGSNRVTDGCTTVCQCCIVGFRNGLQFISRNAYIETAICGDPFFVAGKRAFHQLMSNSLRVFTINSLGDFVLFMGKAFVVVITVFSGIEMLRPKQNVIHHMWVPLTMAGIFAYLIAHCFITVYEMIIDTIFICFCEDCERNDGLTRPYYMSTGLMGFVEKSKQFLAISHANDNRANTPPTTAQASSEEDTAKA